MNNWRSEVIVLSLDSIMFSINHWISFLTSSDNTTRALKLCLSGNSKICWRCNKGQYCKGARKIAIAVDERQPISWFICVNLTHDWFNTSWHNKMIFSFVKKRVLPWERIYTIRNWIQRKTQNKFLKFYYQPLIFYFYLFIFFHGHSRFTGQQEKDEVISLTPLYHFHPLPRHLDISRAITAASSPPHIASSWTRTGNIFWILMANR